ncbi:hypothetical protein DFH08DRAFT_839807 [Mycena albidolilacea]|uniref:Uncharacterized protein n=1 Tax=Mycena albidolilacea TaxID=1033008 RepID=A0AAD7F4A5_9AGAR|nr:hypothetical protein DFH08DRAFT_839807 [Mycena albidolilacea]
MISHPKGRMERATQDTTTRGRRRKGKSAVGGRRGRRERCACRIWRPGWRVWCVRGGRRGKGRWGWRSTSPPCAASQSFRRKIHQAGHRLPHPERRPRHHPHPWHPERPPPHALIPRLPSSPSSARTRRSSALPSWEAKTPASATTPPAAMSRIHRSSLTRSPSSRASHIYTPRPRSPCASSSTSPPHRSAHPPLPLLGVLPPPRRRLPRSRVAASPAFPRPRSRCWRQIRSA